MEKSELQKIYTSHKTARENLITMLNDMLENVKTSKNTQAQNNLMESCMFLHLPKDELVQGAVGLTTAKKDSQWEKRWTEELERLDADFSASMDTVKKTFNKLKLRLNRIRNAKEHYQQRRGYIETLKNPATSLEERMQLIQENPYVSYKEQYETYYLDNDDKHDFAHQDQTYELLVNQTQAYATAMKIRDELLAVLANAKATSGEKQQTIAKFNELKASVGEFNPRNILSHDNEALLAKNQEIEALFPACKELHAQEKKHREALLQSFDTAVGALVSKKDGLAKTMKQKKAELELLVDKKQAAAADNLDEVGSQPDAGQNEIAVEDEEHADGIEVNVAEEKDNVKKQTRINALEAELHTLKTKFLIITEVNEQLSAFRKDYIENHNVTPGKFKMNCTELLGEHRTVTVDMAEEGEESRKETFNVQIAVCQHRDKWSFKSIMEHILKALNLSASKFFQAESKRKMDDISESLQHLPNEPRAGN
jgi:hypothetical protein